MQKNVAICSHYDADFGSYISTPAIIGKDGVEAVVKLPLSADEMVKLQASANEIQDKIKQFS